MSNLTFQQENDKVLDYILDTRYFNGLIDPPEIFRGSINYSVELYITSECNLKCEYCYLMRHGDKLYPPNIRDENKIIDNMHIFFKWMIKRRFIIPKLELFSGEVWGLDLGNRVFDTILEYIDKGLKIESIVTPSNASFLLSEERTNRVTEYIDEFNRRNVKLIISLSLDGLILEERNRPFKDKAKNILRDQDFYDEAFKWAKPHDFGYHPMVNSHSIEKWSDNLDWWSDMFKKYDLSLGKHIMLLEVRNDDWTDDKIKTYINFLGHCFGLYKKELYKNDMRYMAADMFKLLPWNQRLTKDYSNISIIGSGDGPSCSIGRALCIRLGDLTIAPCHRCSYDKFNFGQFEVENNEIIGIKSNNIQFAQVVLTSNMGVSQLGCDTCEIKNMCLRGCMGSQYETMKDPFVPIPSVCKLFKIKHGYLKQRYIDEGIMEILMTEDFGNLRDFIFIDILKLSKKMMSPGGLKR